MAVQLISGPTGSGKTGAAIAELLRLDPSSWNSTARYIVTTRQAARQVTERIIQQANLSGILGNVVCTFYDLAQEFIARSGFAASLISDLQKSLMIEEMLPGAKLDYFGRVAELPGFTGALGQVIGELKLSMVRPEQLDEALRVQEQELGYSSRRKIRELAEMYRRYQEDILLRHDLHDREGVMWRAMEILKERDYLAGFRLFVFDGFDYFNGVQKEFLSLISGRVPEVIVTLNYEPSRPEVSHMVEVSRSFVLGLGQSSENLKSRKLQCRTSLAHLGTTVFSSDVEPVACDDTVTIIEGGNPGIEIELVAEEIRKLVIEQGYRFGEIAIVARDIDSYRARIQRVFRAYHLPVEDSDRPLAGAAVARLLLSCVRAVTDGWRRSDVIQILKSELLTSDLQPACRADVNSTQLGILEGRENWLRSWGDEDKTHDFRVDILKTVVEFQSEAERSAAIEGLVDATKKLLNVFNWRENTEYKAQDAAAYKTILQILDDLARSHKLISKDTGTRQFFSLLERSIFESSYTVPVLSNEVVCLLPADKVYGEKFKAVFIIGLLEKVFPRQIREESFLRDREREALNKSLHGALQIQLPQQETERYYFYNTVSSAQDKLYLCYPLADETAKDSLPSFYIGEVRKLFADELQTIRRDVSDIIPSVESCRDVDGLKRSVVYAFSHLPEDKTVAAKSAYNSLPAKDLASLARVFSDFEERPALIADATLLRRMADTDRVYRCTELESYAACPFMHFCHYTLGLEPIRDEIGGLDWGGILHETLYRVFTTLRGELGDDFSVIELDGAAVILQAKNVFAEKFDNCSRLVNLPSHEKEMQKQSLWAYIERYISSEVKNGWPDFSPTHFELEFGNAAKPGRQRDPKSTEKPLILTDSDGTRVEICGKMDRVDLSPLGALVIDYKLGSSPGILKFEKGLVLQAMIYALALKKVFGIEPLAAEYRPLREWKPDGFYVDTTGINKRNRVKTREEFDEMLSACESLILDIAKDIRAGRISVEPKDCKSYCSYKGICRIDDYQNLLLQARRAAEGEEIEEADE
ncbi:MAG: exodeoxyribonuclease V subunit gamma [Armatimonadota bacterium]|nr:exodeoxyribonuclease V subunit gamma [Armatimonadota bacterium]